MNRPLKCTYCGGTEFYEGPSGGLSVNVLCANESCRHWFNWTPVVRLLEDLDRVEPTTMKDVTPAPIIDQGSAEEQAEEFAYGLLELQRATERKRRLDLMLVLMMGLLIGYLTRAWFTG